MSIRWFERLFWLGLALALLGGYAALRHVAGRGEPDEVAAGSLVVALAFSTALNLLLLWLIAYRASNVGRWIFIALVAIGAILEGVGYGQARDYGDPALAAALVQYLLCAIEIGLLFRRDSRDWFAGRQPVDPEIFR